MQSGHNKYIRMQAPKVPLLLQIINPPEKLLQISIQVKQSIRLLQLLTELKDRNLISLSLSSSLPIYSITDYKGTILDKEQKIQTVAIIGDCGIRTVTIRKVQRNEEYSSSEILQMEGNNDSQYQKIAQAIIGNEQQKLSCLHSSEKEHLTIPKQALQKIHNKFLKTQQQHENKLQQYSHQIENKQKKYGIIQQQLKKTQRIINQLYSYDIGNKYVLSQKPTQMEKKGLSVFQRLAFAKKFQVKSQIVMGEEFKMQAEKYMGDLRSIIECEYDVKITDISSAYYSPEPPKNFLKIYTLLPAKPNTLTMLHLQQKQNTKLFCIFTTEKMTPNTQILDYGFIFNLLTNKSYVPKRNKPLCKYDDENEELILGNKMMVVKNGKLEVKIDTFLTNQSETNEKYQAKELWTIKAAQILFLTFAQKPEKQ